MRDYQFNLQKLYDGGIPVESRAGSTREWLGLKTQVVTGSLPRRPKMRRELGYMELCQLLTGIYEPDLISRVAPNVNMSLFGRSAVYGPRIMPRPTQFPDGLSKFYTSGRDQLSDVINELSEFPESRRAVVTISAPDEPLADQPCISSMQFLLRGGRVNMEAYARSWDLWFGAPHDLIVLSGILQVVASCVGLPCGYISVATGSSHVYERSFPDLSKALEHNLISAWSFQMPNLGDLRLFREWADTCAWETGWVAGAPKHIKENWATSAPRPIEVLAGIQE